MNGGPGGVHVLWTSWATADPPGQVAEFVALLQREDEDLDFLYGSYTPRQPGTR